MNPTKNNIDPIFSVKITALPLLKGKDRDLRSFLIKITTLQLLKGNDRDLRSFRKDHSIAVTKVGDRDLRSF